MNHLYTPAFNEFIFATKSPDRVARAIVKECEGEERYFGVFETADQTLHVVEYETSFEGPRLSFVAYDAVDDAEDFDAQEFYRALLRDELLELIRAKKWENINLDFERRLTTEEANAMPQIGKQYVTADGMMTIYESEFKRVQKAARFNDQDGALTYWIEVIYTRPYKNAYSMVQAYTTENA